MSSRRKSRKIAQNNIWGYVFGSIAALFFLSVFLLKQTQIKEDYNFETFCPVKGPQSVTTVIIDQTDSLSPIQQTSLRNELQKLKDQIPYHGKLEIYPIGSTVSEVIRPVFQMCNPGRGKDIDLLFGNQKRVESRWTEEFNKPIEEILTSLLSAPKESESPIMASIQSVSVTSFKNPQNQDSKRKLVIASDMLQFDDGLSLYKKIPSYAVFKQTEYGRRMRSDMRGVSVEILMIRRPVEISTEELLTFWEDFFKDQGAVVDRVYAITG